MRISEKFSHIKQILVMALFLLNRAKGLGLLLLLDIGME